MAKSNIVAALNNMKARDTMSMVLFVLYKLSENPEYSTLSELSYILDGTSLSNLLDYYGGMTITIPTKAEFAIVVDTLLLYQYHQMDKMSFDEAVKLLGKTGDQLKEIKDCYQKVYKIIEKYNFNLDIDSKYYINHVKKEDM